MRGRGRTTGRGVGPDIHATGSVSVRGGGSQRTARFVSLPRCPRPIPRPAFPRWPSASSAPSPENWAACLVESDPALLATVSRSSNWTCLASGFWQSSPASARFAPRTRPPSSSRRVRRARCSSSARAVRCRARSASARSSIARALFRSTSPSARIVKFFPTDLCAKFGAASPPARMWFSSRRIARCSRPGVVCDTRACAANRASRTWKPLPSEPSHAPRECHGRRCGPSRTVRDSSRRASSGVTTQPARVSLPIPWNGS